MINKVALVTGSNQGIGFAIVEELLKRGVKTVYITSRNELRGHDALKKLQAKGLNPQFYQLDVTDPKCVKRCADYIKMKHGGLDILINNAGVATEIYNKTTYEDALRVMTTNYYAILTVEEHFFPILNQNARVINISSDCGHISNLKNREWISRLTKKDVRRADVDAFVNWFLDSVKNGTWKPEDFFQTELLAYRISKIALCALTIVQQKEVDRDRNISINSLHPGMVQTAMSHGKGPLTMEEASKAPVYLALDVDQSMKGQYFWYDKEAKDWCNPALPLYCDYEVCSDLERPDGADDGASLPRSSLFTHLHGLPENSPGQCTIKWSILSSCRIPPLLRISFERLETMEMVRKTWTRIRKIPIFNKILTNPRLEIILENKAAPPG